METISHVLIRPGGFGGKANEAVVSQKFGDLIKT